MKCNNSNNKISKILTLYIFNKMKNYNKTIYLNFN